MRVLHVLDVALLTQVAASQGPDAASLQGIVETVAGEPLPNAAVELRSIDAGPARIYTTKTAGHGSFAFTNVPHGRYQRTAIRAGWVRGTPARIAEGSEVAVDVTVIPAR